MSAHCTIGLLNSNGTVDFLYRHSDGYPDSAGDILQTHYPDRNAVAALIDLGRVAAATELTVLQARRDGYESCLLPLQERQRISEQHPARHKAQSIAQYREQALAMHAYYVYLYRDCEWLVAARLRRSRESPWEITPFAPLAKWLANAAAVPA